MATKSKNPKVSKQTVEEKKYPAEEFFEEKGPKTIEETPKVEPEEPAVSEPIIKHVKGPRKLNFRGGPSMDCIPMMVLEPGAAVELLEAGAEWSRIKVGSLEGFVMSKFIE